MVNNEYKGNDKIGGGASNNTPTLHRKQLKHKDKTSSILSVVDDIRRSEFQEHNLLIYPDLQSFRQIYSECTKQALDNNEAVFLATTYDSFDRIEDALRSKRISVDDEKKKGNLIIVDAIRTYQIDTYGAMNLAKDLVVRAARDGKEGVFNLSDMGSFFLSERIDELIRYEQSLPKKMDLKFKAICSYQRQLWQACRRAAESVAPSSQYCYWNKKLKYMSFNMSSIRAGRVGKIERPGETLEQA